MSELGIIVFGCARPLHLAEVLESLKCQGALDKVHVWLDGHQGKPAMKELVASTYQAVAQYPVAHIQRHNGNLGFRKLLLQGLSVAVEEFEKIIVLEDDCFPTRDAVEIFDRELDGIAGRDDVFSVYGHPFLVPAEGETCTRFQGWGWGTTRAKLKPMLRELIECYSLTEEDYLAFVAEVMTEEIVSRLDVTPPRQPTKTLKHFFAWDETLALLTALRGLSHKKTPKRTIYNFGAGENSDHFQKLDWYRQPAFNMVSRDQIWDFF